VRFWHICRRWVFKHRLQDVVNSVLIGTLCG
jgi:hypothetical protein